MPSKLYNLHPKHNKKVWSSDMRRHAKSLQLSVAVAAARPRKKNESLGGATRDPI